MTQAPATGTVTASLVGLTPMAHVADVARSIQWYSSLGFAAEHTWTPEGGPIAQALKPGELSYPFYAQHGEFRIDDPDGYCLLVGDTEQR
jgi:hypothetical protein